MIIAKGIPKDTTWPATLQLPRRPLNAINWSVYGKLMRSLTHYLGRPNQKPPFRSYKSKQSWH